MILWSDMQTNHCTAAKYMLFWITNPLHDGLGRQVYARRDQKLGVDICTWMVSTPSRFATCCTTPVPHVARDALRTKTPRWERGVRLRTGHFRPHWPLLGRKLPFQRRLEPGTLSKNDSDLLFPVPQQRPRRWEPQSAHTPRPDTARKCGGAVQLRERPEGHEQTIHDPRLRCI